VIKAAGYHVIVRPDSIETVSEGGILLLPKEKEERNAQEYGTVVDIGDIAFKKYEIGPNGEEIGEPWCKVGDRVQFGRYSGRHTVDPDNPDDLLRVLVDSDIAVVFPQKESNE